MERIEEGSYVLILHGEKKYFKRVRRGEVFSGRGGNLKYDEIIGMDFGSRCGEYIIVRPTLEDVIMFGIRRETQIVYPKDSFYICGKLDLKNGSRLLEVGSGSGALTLIFSRACGPNGKVVSLEKEERHYKNAKRNLEEFGELKNVDLLLKDIRDYEGERFDASFIDIKEPWSCIKDVRRHLIPGAIIGVVVPTANQVSETLKSMQDGFTDLEVIEILLRKYKTVPERVRPFDRMVAHTGYLIFGRNLKE